MSNGPGRPRPNHLAETLDAGECGACGAGPAAGGAMLAAKQRAVAAFSRPRCRCAAARDRCRTAVGEPAAERLTIENKRAAGARHRGAGPGDRRCSRVRRPSDAAHRLLRARAARRRSRPDPRSRWRPRPELPAARGRMLLPAHGAAATGDLAPPAASRASRCRPVAALRPVDRSHRRGRRLLRARPDRAVPGRPHRHRRAGASQWISGPEDIVHTHRLRALFDAVVIGAGTIRADDPQLTTREVEGPSPVRVVLDTERRLDARYRVFRRWPATLLLCAEDACGMAGVGRCAGPPAAARARRAGYRRRARGACCNAACGGCSSRAAASRCRVSSPPARSIGCT